jgi:SAM-dependent methyltransferase
MSRWYRLLYALGLTVWEEDSESLTPQFHELIAREEATRQPPFGPALDLGCGTGRWSVELARRGWNVVGVDVVPKAIQAARHRAEKAGVDIDFQTGDVTALREAGVGSGFSFFLDVECFNHLSDTQRRLVGQEVDALATEDASMLLLVWSPGRRGPLPPGADEDDLARAFPNWQIRDKQPYAGDLPFFLRSTSLDWYRLVRT